MGYKILNVELSKTTVNTNDQLIIRVSLNTWGYISKNYSWLSLKNNFAKWGDLIGN